MYKPKRFCSRDAALLACLAGLVALVVLGAPSRSDAGIHSAPASQFDTVAGTAQSLRAIPVAAAQDAAQPAAPAGSQSDSQAAPAAAAPAAPKPVVLPDGDGKPIATEFCQDCHRLTNLTKAHKDLDDWKDTIHTMMDRGARIPDDKVDALAQYLVTNFGPKPAGSDSSSGSVSSAPTSSAAVPTQSASLAPDAASGSAPASAAPAKAATVELPEGDGKAIATENCQACHKLTNLTKAHKSLDDWKDTVQTMIDRGANVPPDKVDTLVQYLAKNFGPKDDPAPASPAPSPAN